MNKSAVVKFLLVLASPTFLNAETILLKEGESHSYHKKGLLVVVKCGAEEAQEQNSAAPVCHYFHSDSACQRMPIGTQCLMRGDQKGRCVSESFFAGAPNCKCK